MDKREIYRDIAGRTKGEVYIGVVGPVRSGKSTFIERFMETSVIPNIKGDYEKKRASDELPQSSGGKTVMTTEPKFIPNEAVTVAFGEGAEMKVRMIDCVGYLIPDALGTTEDGETRMVRVPWSDTELTFEDAAEQGTKKVICDHSTVAMLVTCDGSFGEIPRENYVEAEERIVKELREIGKPFVTVLNSSNPTSEAAETLALELEEKYDAPVALINCTELDAGDVNGILEMLLYEFPVTEIALELPDWISALPAGHELESLIINALKDCKDLADSMNGVSDFAKNLEEKLGLDSVIGVKSSDPATGSVTLEAGFPEELFYSVLCELTGVCISDRRELVSVLMNLSDSKREYEKYEAAINDLEDKGYGVVTPEIDDLILEEPQIIRQSGSYGVKLKARASSIHLIRADIETEINPIVGSEEQTEEMIKYLMSRFEDDPKSLWESNIFGKNLYELVGDGIRMKLDHLSEDSREKLSETLSRIVNESSNGLICILL